MKILIATGIFEPEAGGPATLAPKLARLLVEKGWDVTVLTYSDKLQYDFDAAYPFKLVRVIRKGRLFNRIRFFFAVMRYAADRDCIYSLDWFAVGLPLSVAAKILEKPYIVRVGGDYAWEQAHLQSGAPAISLNDFYESGMYRRGFYRVWYELIRYVLKRAECVVFNTDLQRVLYERYFSLPHSRTSVIYNAVPREELKDIVRDAPNHEIVFWGRFNVMKNIESLVRAFAAAKLPGDYTLRLIGDGPQKVRILKVVEELHLTNRVRIEPGMRLHAVLQYVKNARAFVLPSWTDISPNQVYEALAIGLPSLVTKENFLNIKDQLPEMIDPRSIDDIAAKLEMFADDKKYADFAKRFTSISFDQSWDTVLREHLQVFEKVVDQKIRVLQIGADRSKQGILYPNSPAIRRQIAYGEHFDRLDIIGFSRRSDRREPFEASDRVRVHPTNSFSPLLYGLDALEIAKKLPTPRVVSAQDPFETGLIAWLISRMYGVPLHVQVHTDFLSPAYVKLSLMNRVRAQLAEFVLRRATRVRVVSDRIKAGIEHTFHLEVSVSVIPIYADIERLKHIQPNKELRARFAQFRTKLLVVSRLEYEKNNRLAISAFAKSAPRDACLIIVGGGSRRAPLERLARDLGVTNRVFFEGAFDSVPYFAIADLLLVPSHYEGYGLVIVEALAAGKPVLSTNVGIAEDMGATVTSPEKFTGALSEWFTNGPRTGRLQNYPYKDFGQYVQAYSDDIRACTEPKNLHNG